jgi:hypothetical protein
MKISMTAALWIATAATALPLAATANAGVPPSFQTPSGNILCWVADNAASCRVITYAYAVPPPPGDCMSPGWGNSFFLDQGKPPFLTCDSDPSGTYNGLRTHTTLGYGQTQSVGVMTCDSETSGVTCTDNSSGHFFRVSRDSYQLG